MTNQEKANAIAARIQTIERMAEKVYSEAIEALDEAGASPDAVAPAEQVIEMIRLAMDLAHRMIGNAANTVGDVTIQSGGQDKPPPGGGN